MTPRRHCPSSCLSGSYSARDDWNGRIAAYFFSREEPRAHVHVQHAEGEAKFWIEPAVELHANYGLKAKRLAEAQKLVEEHVNEIRNAWAKHFPG